MALAPGVVLGDRYELRDRVSDDNLTEEWVATDRILARSVMVEVLSTGAPRDPFVAAAAAAARLAHPNIVATYDSGVFRVAGASDLPYVVTERAAGKSVASLLHRTGPLGAERAIVVGRQLAHALDAAHRVGVVHGGVGPDTVMIGEDDRVKLSRFAASGARARIDDLSPATDQHDLVGLLRTVAGDDRSPALAGVLAAAGPGGDITDTAGLAQALDRLDLPSEALTPPLGVPVGYAGRGAPAGAGRGPGPGSRPGSRAGARSGAGLGSGAGGGGPGSGSAESGGRSSMVAGIVVGLVLVLAIAAAGFALVSNAGGGNGSGGGSGGASSGRGGDLAVAAAHSFNPLGDQSGHVENEQLAAKVTDGDTATYWSTSEYKTRKFGNLKTGTGIYLTLDASHTLHQLTVTSPSTGWTFSVYVADQQVNDLAGWGKPVAGPVTVANPVTQVDLNGTHGTDVLVWITDLGGQMSKPDLAAFPYRVDISELAVR